jgi:valyl-tRNA synthetase
MIIPRCSRTGDIIEQLLREQWFVNCKNMASRAFKAVEDGSLKLNPSIYNETWFDWLNNTKYR